MSVHDTLQYRARAAMDMLHVLRGELSDAVVQIPSPETSATAGEVRSAMDELATAINAADLAAGSINGAVTDGDLICPVENARQAARQAAHTYLVCAFDVAEQAGVSIDEMIDVVRRSRGPVDARI